MSAPAVDPGAVLQVNWWRWDPHAAPMGWFLFDFAVFVAIVVVLAARPLRAVFAERHAIIKRSIAEAARMHAEAVRDQAASRDRLAGAQAEAQALAARSQREGEQERDQLVARAEEAARRVARDAGRMQAEERRRVRARLRGELAAKIAAAAGVQLAARCDDGEHARLVESALVDLERARVPLPTAARQSA